MFFNSNEDFFKYIKENYPNVDFDNLDLKTLPCDYGYLKVNVIENDGKIVEYTTVPHSDIEHLKNIAEYTNKSGIWGIRNIVKGSMKIEFTWSDEVGDLAVCALCHDFVKNGGAFPTYLP